MRKAVLGERGEVREFALVGEADRLHCLSRCAPAVALAPVHPGTDEPRSPSTQLCVSDSSKLTSTQASAW